MSKKTYSLREKKFAKTKVAIMKAFMSKLEHAMFDDISVKDVCRQIDISEGTFFNYFHQKMDIIHYYVQLNMSEVVWRTEKRSAGVSALSKVDAAFDIMLEKFKNPNVLYQTMSLLILAKEKPAPMKVSALEKSYAIPGCNGVEDMEEQTILFEEFFERQVIKAVKDGELPPGTVVREMVMALKSIMVGIPLAVKFDDFRNLKKYQKNSLAIFWKGVGRRSL